MNMFSRNRWIVPALGMMLLGVAIGWYWRGGHEVSVPATHDSSARPERTGKRTRSEPPADIPEVTETIRGGVRVVRRGNRTQVFRIDGPTPEFDLEEFREGFRDLASKYSGDALVKAQIDYIDDTRWKLKPEDVIDFLSVIYQDSGDTVVSYALSSCSDILVSRGGRSGLERIAKLGPGRFADLIARQVGKNLGGGLSLEEFGEIMRDPELAPLMKRMAPNYLVDYARSRKLSSGDLKALDSLASSGIVSEKNLRGVLYNASPGSDFQGIMNSLLTGNTISDEKRRRSHAKACFDGWVNRAPRKAAEFFENSNLPGEERRDFLKVLVSQWFQSSPKAVSEWAIRRRGTPDYDLSASLIARHLVGYSPFEATQWALSIDDETQRASTVREIARHIDETDYPEELRGYLESTKTNGE